MNLATTTKRTDEPIADGLDHQVVHASAGAGKTYALSTRYLGLIAAGAGPESILATTFTRKAAGEILERVLLRLALATTDPASSSALRDALGAGALTPARCGKMLGVLTASLDRLSIGTIDSFLYRLVCSVRIEMGLPKNVELIAGDEPLAVCLRRRAVEAVFGGGDLDAVIDLLRHAGKADAQRGVAQLIDGLVSGDLYDTYRRYPTESLWDVARVASRPMNKTHLAACIDTLQAASELMPNKSWANAHRNAVEAALQSNWHVFLEKGIASKIITGEQAFYRRPIPEDVAAVYRPLVDHAIGWLVARHRDQTVATYHLLDRFERHYRRLRREQGVMLYSDLALVLVDWLGRADAPTLADFYYRLDGQIVHLLLDEFQDTSMVQWQVLRPMAQEIASHGDRTHSLFCVGDVKQAIYGWRGGTPQIFDGLADELHLPSGSRQSLDRSYRSSPIVLDTVNQVFESLAQNPAVESIQDLATRWAGSYTEQRAAHHEQPGYVQLVTAPAVAGIDVDDSEDSDGLFDPQEQPAASDYDHYVAGFIAEVYNQSPGCTVGVLVSTNDQVRRVRLLLRSIGLHASGEGGAIVTDHPAVNVVMSALTLADYPEHTAAAFNVFHSPLRDALGLDEDSVASGLAIAGGRIRRALMLEGYAATLAGWARALAPSCDRSGMARQMQLIELADRYDRSRTLRPGDFVRYVRSAQVQEVTPSKIRVMTVHKAKGLEFDSVVLPYLNRKLADDRGLVDVLYGEDPNDVRAVYRRADKGTRAVVPELAEAYRQTQAKRTYDDLSKLYVALTRARYGLYMMIPPLQPKKDGRPKAVGYSTPSHAAILRHALGPGADHESYDGGEILYETGDPGWAEALGMPQVDGGAEEGTADPIRLDGLLGTSAGSSRSWTVVTPSSAHTESLVNVDDLLRIDTPVHRTRGTIMHAWLAMIRWLQPGEELEEYLDRDRLIQEARRVAPPAAPEFVEGLIEEFRLVLEDPILVRVLSRPPMEDPSEQVMVWRERTFAVPHDHQLLKGIFDRVVMWSRDHQCYRAEIIDYKTDRLHADQPTEPVDRYRDQLATYRLALSTMLQMEPSAITTQLLFIDARGCSLVKV